LFYIIAMRKKTVIFVFSLFARMQKPERETGETLETARKKQTRSETKKRKLWKTFFVKLLWKTVKLWIKFFSTIFVCGAVENRGLLAVPGAEFSTI